MSTLRPPIDTSITAVRVLLATPPPYTKWNIDVISAIANAKEHGSNVDHDLIDSPKQSKKFRQGSDAVVEELANHLNVDYPGGGSPRQNTSITVR